MVADPALPEAAVLLDERDAAAVLDPLAVAWGGRLVDVALQQVAYRPGRRIVVRYAARMSWRDGTETTETLAAMADPNGLPDGTPVVADADGLRVAVWRYPFDPLLPGLPAAADPEAARRLLVELGAPDAPVQLTSRVYRPTSRAVLAVRGAGTACYLKVVRPGGAAPLHALHEELRRLLPVPGSHGYAWEQGIVVLEALRGQPLTAALARGAPLPAPSALLALLDVVARAPTSAPPMPPALTVADQAAALARIAPDQAARVAAIAEEADAPWTPDRTVHGDFYDAQLLVEGGAVTGLLDVDGLRPGDDTQDLATLLAHLDVLAWARPKVAARIRGYRDAVATAAGERVDPNRLARRVAGHALALAVWPFRVQRPDWPQATRELIDLAASWLPARAGSHA